jgi:hypothetical protein
MSDKIETVYKSKSLYASKRGAVQVSLKLQSLKIPNPDSGLFLNQFKISWHACLVENPFCMILVDCHKPFGLHIHIDNGDRASFESETLEEAFAFFQQKIKSHFGIEQ